MKKRKSFFPRRRKSSGRYGLEAAILCVLLMVAVYVSSSGDAEDAVREIAQNVAVAQKNPPTEKRVLDAASVPPTATASCSKTAGTAPYASGSTA